MSSLSIPNLTESENKPSTKSGRWSENVKSESAIFYIRGLKHLSTKPSLTTSIHDPWLLESTIHDCAITSQTKKLLLSDLGWTREQIIETRSRLKSFEEDWNRPEMDIYDEL